MKLKKHILLVEDEENFGSLLQNYLKLSGYEVNWVKDGTHGYSSFFSNTYDLCIFDVMMPNMDGFSLTEKIREKDKSTPILFLTARKMKEDMIRGYKVGADDYLNKPFDIEVLLLKLDVLFKRNNTSGDVEKQVEFRIGSYHYDTQKRILSHQNEARKLSPKEGALFELLVQHINEVTPRELALTKIWGEDSYFTTRSMDVYITKLRKYLSHDASLCIENIHSSGYGLYMNK